MISLTKLVRFVALPFAVLFASAAAHAFVLELTPGQTGAEYSHTIIVNPAPGAGAVFGATNLPAGLSMNGATGVISGVPIQAGVFTGVISLTEGQIVNNVDYTLTITAALGTPEITSDLSALSAVGAPFTFFVTASDSPTSFNVGALPAGLQFNAQTNAITGTPTIAGTYHVSLSANNIIGTGNVVTLTITIEPSGPVPEITSDTTTVGDLNAAFSYQIFASNSATSYSANNLPLGLSLNEETGLITGTPTVGGVTVATLTAANGNGSSANFSLTFLLGPISTILNEAPIFGYAGYPIATYELNATNSPLSFNVGALPTGLVYANGQITGTPTSTVTTTVSVSANNALGTGLAKSLTVLIGTAVAPSFVQQPQSQTVNVGDEVMFTAIADGTPRPTFQWYKGDIAIEGATSQVFVIEAAQLTHEGSYRVIATNIAGSTPSEFVTLTVNAPVTGFASWGVEYFSAAELQNVAISGPNADADSDGLSNLVEYALGLHPRQVSSGNLPATGTTATHWTYTYTRPADRGDLVYSVQASSNLTTWDSIVVTHAFVSTQNGIETWRATVPLSGNASLFFRLRVTR